MISYISTRGKQPQDFENIFLSGLAPDGGLYVPEQWPPVIKYTPTPYQSIAEAVMFPFVEYSIDRAAFRKIIDETYSRENFRAASIAPLKEIYPGLHIM